LKVIENDYLPGDLEALIKAFVADYNNLRYHMGIGGLTPAEFYFGRGQTILKGSNDRHARCTKSKPRNITSETSKRLLC